MLPTRDLVLEAKKGTNRRVIDIKPLVGERIKPREAFKPIYKQLKIDFCMVGMTTIEEGNDDSKWTRRILTDSISKSLFKAIRAELADTLI